MLPVAALALVLLLTLTGQTGVIPSRSTVTIGGTATKPCGTLRSDGGLAVATTGTVEEILRTYTLPGGTLAVNGDRLVARATFATAANVNSKTARIRFGGIGGTILIGPTTTTSGAALFLNAELFRTGAATQAAPVFALVSPATTSVGHAAPTQTLANNIDVVVTGLTPTAAGDLTLQAFVVECGKAP